MLQGWSKLVHVMYMCIDIYLDISLDSLHVKVTVNVQFKGNVQGRAGARVTDQIVKSYSTEFYIKFVGMFSNAMSGPPWATCVRQDFEAVRLSEKFFSLRVEHFRVPRKTFPSQERAVCPPFSVFPSFNPALDLCAVAIRLLNTKTKLLVQRRP